MVQCSFCGSTILFGGSQEGALRFCNASCRKKSALIRLADQLPAELGEEAAQFNPAHPPEFRLTKPFWIGLVTLVVGSGPLLVILLLASLRITKDPNPNPVGLGFIAFLTFWPSVGVVVWQLRASLFRYRADRKRFQKHLAEPIAPGNAGWRWS